MMNKILKIPAYLVSITISLSAHSGTKGFAVMLENIGDENFYETPIFMQYLKNSRNYDQDKCWHYYGDGMSGIDYMEYGNWNIKKHGDPLQKATSANQIIKRIRKDLHVANEKTTSEGFHGMYIIKPENGYLTIMGIGANADPKKGLTGISPVIKGIKLDQSKPKEGAKIFERSLCRVSKPFNIGFGV